MHPLGRLLVIHSLCRDLVDEVVMPGIEPVYVALAEQRDRLPGRFAVGAAKIIAAMQSVLGVLHGHIPDLLHLVLRDLSVLAEVLDAVSQAIDVSAGGRQRALERADGGDDFAIAVAREQAHDRCDLFLQGFRVRAHDDSLVAFSPHPALVEKIL